MTSSRGAISLQKRFLEGSGKFNDSLRGVCNKQLTDVLLHQVQKEKNIHRCTESADQNGSVLNPILIN